MPKPGLAIVIGEGKPKSEPSSDDEHDTDGPKDLGGKYAQEAFDAINDDDASAFKAAIRGLVRCCAEKKDDSDEAED